MEITLFQGKKAQKNVKSWDQQNHLSVTDIYEHFMMGFHCIIKAYV